MADEIINAIDSAFSDGPSSKPDEVDKPAVRRAGRVIQNTVDEVRGLVTLTTQWKAPVRVASTVSIQVSTGLVNGAVIDGVTVATGDRVLLKDSTNPQGNGIYIIAASGGASRAADADTAAEILGMAVFATMGTANGGKAFTCTAVSPIIVGTTQLPFVEISNQVALAANLALKADQSALASEIASRSALISPSASGALVGGSEDVFTDNVPGFQRVSVDAIGNITQATTDAGDTIIRPPISRGIIAGLRASVSHIIGIGQSWKGGTGGAPALTTTATGYPNIKMFVGGIRPLDTLAAPAAYASLVDAVESNNTGNVRGETPMSGLARGFVDSMAASGGPSLGTLGAQLLLSVVAPGGESITAFSRFATYYNQVMEQVTAGYARAQDLGATYRLTFCPVMLGKGDYDLGEVSQSAFQIALATLVDDVNAAVKALVPDHPDVPFLVFQTGSHGHAGRRPSVDLAIVDLDRTHPLIFFAGPMYPYQRAAADTVHFTAASYKRMGAVAGVLAKRLIIDGIEPNAMLPIEVMAQGKVITLRYAPPVLPLVLDNAAVGNPANSGFDLVDYAGNPLPISSVAVSYDRVIIVVSANLPTIWKLRYGFTGAYSAGQVSGPRGALRDSQAIVFDPSGINATLRNWAGLFEISR